MLGVMISLYARAYTNLFNLVLGDLMTLLTEQLRNIGQHILFSALYSSAMMASSPPPKPPPHKQQPITHPCANTLSLPSRCYPAFAIIASELYDAAWRSMHTRCYVFQSMYRPKEICGHSIILNWAHNPQLFMSSPPSSNTSIGRPAVPAKPDIWIKTYAFPQNVNMPTPLLRDETSHTTATMSPSFYNCVPARHA